jgi:hypothetical protein
MNGLSPSAQAFAAQVYRVGSWRAELPPPTSFSLEGVRAMSELVLEHPTLKGGRRPDKQLRLFGSTEDDVLEALRGHSVGYLLAGAVALGLSGRDVGNDLAAGLIHAAADPDPESLLLRANLQRERLFEPPPRVIPEWLEEINRFVERNCFAGVVQAVLEVSRWAGGRSSSYSTGITKITPSPVCAGSQLTLHGSAFGATQPADVVVYVPTTSGAAARRRSKPGPIAPWSCARLPTSGLAARDL